MDKDKNNIVSGNTKPAPIVLSPGVQKLCNDIDKFYEKNPKQHKKQKASDLIKGALYAARLEYRSNPDWMSQSANSAREVLYPFWGRGVNDSFIKICKKYAVGNKKSDNEESKTNKQNFFKKTFVDLELIYRKLNDITHHGIEITKKGFKDDSKYLSFSEDDFEKLLLKFVYTLSRAINFQQIYSHELIDSIILKQECTKGLKNDLNIILNLNDDAKLYFFMQADERWIGWLWKNGFLDILKKQPKDTKKYNYGTPEINYIAKIAKVSPDFVVNQIILKGNIATTKDNFNPELIDIVLRICSELDAKYLIKVIPKIEKENWIKLMSPFGYMGVEYEKIFETLYKAKNIEEMITLARIILTVKSKTELNEDTSDKNPFYIRDFTYTKVFEYLEKIEEVGEKILDLLVSTVKEIAEFGELDFSGDSVFSRDDFFYLYDVDFFKDEYKETTYRSSRDSIKGLMLFLANVAKDLIEKKCGDGDREGVKNIFNTYIGSFDSENAKLPDTLIMWQLRLFILSLCPEVFKDEIQKSFFRLISNNKIHFEVKSGAEYGRLLQNCFKILSVEEQNRYKKEIERLINLECDGKTKEQHKHLMCSGGRIFCLIGDKEKAKSVFDFDCAKNDTKPSASVVFQGSVSTVVSQSPITQEEFDKKPIDEVVALLQEWTHEKLDSQNVDDDLNKPMNIEGAGNLLQTGVSNRFKDFIKDSNKFLNNNLNVHYVYAFLHGAQEAVKKGKRVGGDEWKPLLKAIKNLIKSDLKNQEKIERGFYDTWIADWEEVCNAMADLLQELLSEKNEQITVGDFDKYRSDFLNILEFLLRYKQEQNSENIDNDSESTMNDPYSIAINSVKGRAFQAFLMFVYQDGKELKSKKIKIKKDIKTLYENILSNEDTTSMMFMYGRNLPTFYFRDAEWTKDILLQDIFNKNNRDLALAGTEGYLSQTLYKEMFKDSDFQKLYEKWIELEETDYTNGQKHWTDINEALATHLALAFIYFGLDVDKELGFKDGLLKKFWEIENPGNTIRYYEFISFIGRSVLTSDKTGNEWTKENNIDIEKFIRFWDWILKNDKITDPKVFSGFGFWINPDKEILNDEVVIDRMVETLEKSGGDIDWDYGLKKRLPIFAEKNGPKTLEIIRKYILSVNGELNQNHRLPVFLDDEIKNAISIIYKKGTEETRQEAGNLINELIEKGSAPFYGLKDILK